MVKMKISILHNISYDKWYFAGFDIREEQMMTKERLQQYRWLVLEIKQLEERLVELESKARKMTGRITGELIGGKIVSDKMAELVCAITDLNEVINLKRLKSIKEEICIENSLNHLLAEQSCILRYRYLEGYNWRKIGNNLSFCERQIHNIHIKALLSLND